MELNNLMDRFVGLAASRVLLERLEESLEDLCCEWGRLYLLDNTTMTFYPVAAFGCHETDEEITFDAALIGEVAHAQVLYHWGDPVGLLVATGISDDESLRILVAILGPAIVGVQQAEASLGQLRQAHEQISHLVTAGRLLRHHEIDVLLVEIIQAVLAAVDAQVAAILTPDRPSGELVIRTTWGLREDHVDAIRLRGGRQRVVDQVFEQGEALRVTGDAVSERLDLSTIDANLSGLLALPLSVGDRRLGVLLLANPEREFTGDSERLGQTVCDMAAIALDNAQLVQARLERERLGREMDLARSLQAQMSPTGALRVGEIEVAGANRCAEETGGDYFSYVERNGRLSVLIGDVTGHGFGAALFTTAAHAIIQQQLAGDAAIDSAMRTLNEGLYLTHSGRFMTAAMVEIDPESLRAQYFSAGHNPLLWIHQGEVRWLESHGVPLGISQQLLADDPTGLQLCRGDTLLLYTDGFTEAFNRSGTCSGEDRFADWVLDGLHHCFGPEELVGHLFAAADAWMEGTPPMDDLTLVVVQV